MRRRDGVLRVIGAEHVGTVAAEQARMINLSEIKPGMPVVCSEDGQFAVVDHTEGNASIKLSRDKAGEHHYIPISWVTKVDDKVHVDRPGKQAMREWSSVPPPMESAR
jgi:hypothetical protein